MNVEYRQIDFFRDEDSTITQFKVMGLAETVNKIRKAFWAKDNLRDRQISELREELEFLKRNICRPS